MAKDQETKLYFGVTMLNVVVTIAEFIGGTVSGSLSLLSDAVHNLSDVGAIIISFVAHLIGGRKRNERKTFGYQRAETLAAFTNGIILIIISIGLFFEAIQRFWRPAKIQSGVMLIVSVVGLLANFMSMFALRQESKNSLNMRATFLHMLSDALSSVAVVFGAIVIYFYKLPWLDPVLTILVSIFVLHEALEITSKAVSVLMESNPDIDLHEVNKIVLAVPEIRNIHHVHVWRYSDDLIMLDAHLNVAPDLTAGDFEKITQKIGSELKEKLGINHYNFQVECERGKNDGMLVVKHPNER